HFRMEDDGFTRVWRSKKQRTGGVAAALAGARKTAPCTTRVDGDEKEVETTMRRAMEIMEGHKLLWAWTRREVEKALRGRPLQQVVILGNGNFDGSLEPGAAQLALALRMAESFPSASVHFQDPQCTPVECAWLEGRGIDVRRQTGMQPPEMKGDAGCRLVFFIHNPHGLMEQLLSSDWEFGGTSRSLLVCNDYDGWTEGEFEDAIDGRMPATRQFVRQAKILRLPSFDHFPFAFHHTAFIYLPEDAKLTDTV
ncbi:hypothetical protein PENTCL1PPCAC_16278, partial [Pristionchus entomophagus]